MKKARVIYNPTSGKELLKKNLNDENEWDFEIKEEYYFAIGQVISYILNKRNTKDKPVSEILEFLETKNIEKLKKKLVNLMKKYGYSIDRRHIKFSNLYSKILTENKFSGKVDEVMMLAGFLSKNLFY